MKKKEKKFERFKNKVVKENENKFTAIMFVEATPDGELVKKLRINFKLATQSELGV